MTKLHLCPDCYGKDKKCPTCNGFGQVNEQGLKRFDLAQKVKRKETKSNPYIDNF